MRGAMRTANPALTERVFADRAQQAAVGGAMTIQGTVNKTGAMLVLTMVAAAFTWNAQLPGLTILGAIGGLIVALITVFKKEWAATTAPAYAVLEGLFLGGISSMFEAQYPGIVTNAVSLTFGTLGVLLIAYKSGVIKATENFKLGVTAATGGIFFVYMLTWILGFFGVNLTFIHGNGLLGIGISLFIVVIAALNLVLDFDFIERGAEANAPKYMEWYAAFGLMVTLIWLYLEILRLLAKLQSRD